MEGLLHTLSIVLDFFFRHRHLCTGVDGFLAVTKIPDVAGFPAVADFLAFADYHAVAESHASLLLVPSLLLH